MPINPDGSLLTFTWTPPLLPSVTAVVAVTSIVYNIVDEPYERADWTVARQQEVKNVDGSGPIFGRKSGDVPYQYFDGCNPNQTARPLGTDDANLDNIYRRWDIKRYEIDGSWSNLDADIASLTKIAQAHDALLAKFKDFLNKAKSANISFTNLVTNFQPETFAYLTTTYLTMAGTALGVDSPESNVLIAKFSPSVEDDLPTDAARTTSTVSRSFKMTVEKRIAVPASSSTW